MSTYPALEGAALDRLLAELDEAIGRLAGPDASLDQLVGDYERAQSLLILAQSRFEVARSRAAALQHALLAPGSSPSSSPESS